METPNYYAIIPANVRYDQNLSPNSKLLYGEITALCNQTGECWAKNEYFSDLYNVSLNSISSWISKLVKYGYITRNIIYKEGSKEILKRSLKILGDPLQNNLVTPPQKNCEDNNTIINNTINNSKRDAQFEDFWLRYKKKIGKHKCLLKFRKLKDTEVEKILEVVDKYVKSTPDETFRMHPITYLNGKRWEDEIIYRKPNNNFNNNNNQPAPSKGPTADEVMKELGIDK